MATEREKKIIECKDIVNALEFGKEARETVDLTERESDLIREALKMLIAALEVIGE